MRNMSVNWFNLSTVNGVPVLYFVEDAAGSPNLMVMVMAVSGLWLDYIQYVVIPALELWDGRSHCPCSTWIQYVCVCVCDVIEPQAHLMWSSPVIPASRPGVQSSAFMTLMWPHHVLTRRAAPSHWGSSTLSFHTHSPSGSPTSLQVSVTPSQPITISDSTVL